MLGFVFWFFSYTFVHLVERIIMITYPGFTSHKGKYHFSKERKRDALNKYFCGLVVYYFDVL